MCGGEAIETLADQVDGDWTPGSSSRTPAAHQALRDSNLCYPSESERQGGAAERCGWRRTILGAGLAPAAAATWPPRAGDEAPADPCAAEAPFELFFFS